MVYSLGEFANLAKIYQKMGKDVKIERQWEKDVEEFILYLIVNGKIEEQFMYSPDFMDIDDCNAIKKISSLIKEI